MQSSKNTKTCKLKGIVLSDVHLFHDKAKTANIVDALFTSFPIHERFRDVDIFFISGDLFDRSIFLPNGDVYEAMRFCHHLLTLCSTYDIALRVLEGTPSHDWKQSRMLIELNEQREKKVDVKHVTDLSIEYIEKFDMNVLYVPDEWSESCATTLTQVKDLLRKHGLDKVDFSIMHGCFGYQFPVSLSGKVDTHSEQEYLDMTRHLIFIGHYHTSSKYDRIYVPGSFDRLKHNEEEDKGYYEFSILRDDTAKVKFVVNEKATIFKTIDTRGKEVKDIIVLLDELVKDFDRLVYIKLLVNRTDAIYEGVEDLKSRYPRVVFSIDTRDKKKSEENTLAQTIDIVKPVSLDKDTILRLMSARLSEKYPDKSKELNNLFEGVVNEHNDISEQSKGSVPD